MLYNGLIGYNQTNVTYNGTLILNVIGLTSPIIVNNTTVVFSTSEDNSNFTTMGIISYDTDPFGVMTFEVTEEQADAIVGAEFIVIESSAEFQIDNISNSGTLLIP